MIKKVIFNTAFRLIKREEFVFIILLLNQNFEKRRDRGFIT